MTCKLCETKKQGELKIYQDSKCTAFLSKSPATLGHIKIIPNQHIPIIEQIPDFIIDHMFVITNKISSVLFESLNIQGTNIIINNGISAGQEHPHFSINLIPRTEKDMLNFNWEPKVVSDEDMNTIVLKLKEHTAHIGAFENEEKQTLIDPQQQTEQLSDEDEENY